METSRKSHFIINNKIIYYPEDNRLTSAYDKEISININAPASRCLLLLIEHQKKILSRDDFLEVVWNRNGMHVLHNTFYQNISLLRKALKKAGLEEDIIVTIRKKGVTLSPKVNIKLIRCSSPPPAFLSLKPLSTTSELLQVSNDDAKYHERLNKGMMKFYANVKHILITVIIAIFFLLHAVSIYILVNLEQ
ncbi:TPA: transcriptional regulator [Klebsiella pneumoniae]|uniref:winged helix-turn-helix domain-containing protein n=1 Tax=Klebsiella TaxID=570 RepID=UPI000693E674|nr:winged helix-turn-helix domain-containing protein [Klebsiella pneumoniae]AUN53793.1 hypothetical protein C0078_19410 [Klebsiella pneumoniae]EIV5841193.1 winged helix-turn-helix domain-containing protein [Klebsiella pneumoniae]EIV5853609.1 winged helix-turn-helix domain-containing protein [Klebsiella pneumoniae]EIW8697704.1 hypothetical protein [Klebsiella pneumoniae]EIX9515752.1 winged helix-turn-helix domain-containing protein [Klebsiella pneumoniae]